MRAESGSGAGISWSELWHWSHELATKAQSIGRHAENRRPGTVTCLVGLDYVAGKDENQTCTTFKHRPGIRRRDVSHVLRCLPWFGWKGQWPCRASAQTGTSGF